MQNNKNIVNLIETLTENFLNEISIGKFHVSDELIKKINLRKKQSIGYKPIGFWYSCNDEWLKWLRSEMPHWEGEYYYKINIDDGKMLKLSNFKELIEFTKKYGIKEQYNLKGPEELNFKHINIDWPLVAKQYSGIEICPYIFQARLKLLWSYGWDVASGCIWNKNAIHSIELVNKPQKGKEAVHEEVIGTSGGVRYYQMGGSLPDKLYNKTANGKPTREPGVPNLKKSSRKRNKMTKSSEDKPGKKEKRWYEKVQYKSFKVIFEEANDGDILVEYPGDPEKENTPSRGIEGEFPFMNQIFYHGTNQDFGSGDYIEPPSITNNVSEKGRKKNLDKVFFTMDVGSAKIYAGRAVQSLGGSPHVYKVQPLGSVEWVNKTPGTTVLMAPQARVIEKVE